MKTCMDCKFCYDADEDSEFITCDAPVPIWLKNYDPFGHMQVQHDNVYRDTNADRCGTFKKKRTNKITTTPNPTS